MTKLRVDELARMNKRKKGSVIYLDKQKSNIQGWIDSGLRKDIDIYSVNMGIKKQTILEQALTLYMMLATEKKLEEVVDKYLPKEVKEEN